MIKNVLPITILGLLLNAGCTHPENNAKQSASSVRVFWDQYQFNDSTKIVQPEVGEQAIVDFITLADQSDYSESTTAIQEMLQRASEQSGTVLKFFIDTYSKYLYDPNSPMYNEALYLPVLEYAIQDTSIPDYERQRFQDRLNLLKRNNPGSKATNFDFSTSDGDKTNLYSVEAKHVLLFFYEPGCGGCAKAIEDLQQINEVQEWIARKDLLILAIYANAEPNLWKEYQQYIPQTWVNGINADRSILAHNLYDLKASPTFYLLNERKDILLKDSPLAVVINYLAAQQ